MRKAFTLLVLLTVVIGSNSLKAQFITTSTSGFTGNIYHTGGNVGIGTTAPLYKLDVNGTIRTNDFRVEQPAGLGAAILSIRHEGTDWPMLKLWRGGVEQWAIFANSNNNLGECKVDCVN